MKIFEESENRKNGIGKERNTEQDKNNHRIEKLNEAKRIVMNRFHITESEAHRYIQKRAMDSGTDLVEMSEMIILLYGNEE